MSKKTERNSFDRPSSLLDATNLAILRLLLDDPRLAMSELARRVGMSAPAVTERVQRLQEAGVILGARLDIDQSALGLGITAFVRVRPMPGQLQSITELVKKTPEVVECHRVTGEDCFIMKVLVGRVELLEAVLDEILRFGNTTSSIVQSTPVPLRAPPLPEPAQR
ncbi:Lrp/AsnC family transcriptional regulator [Dokdonella soli]|uniref:Lrp/AsnC family transcriptional regulator n=1 Tax=Dokdonella soli TaxID=529810 RepID=A0ABN1IDA0_9GAMM